MRVRTEKGARPSRGFVGFGLQRTPVEPVLTASAYQNLVPWWNRSGQDRKVRKNICLCVQSWMVGYYSLVGGIARGPRSESPQKYLPVRAVVELTLVMDFVARTTVPLSGEEPSWVLNLACDVPGQRLAAATSRCEICLFDRPTMKPLTNLEVHGARVNEMTFAPASVLYSASSDGLIRGWDCKATSSSKPSTTLRDAAEEVWSLSLGASHQLAAGTESAVVIWDLRKTAKPLCRWEVHTEAVTQVRYLNDSARLLSASMDGLVCELDCSQTEEDDAVLNVFNTESPVTTLGVFGANKSPRIYCTSSLETLTLWDIATGDRIGLFDQVRTTDAGTVSSGKLSVEAGSGGSVDYLIGCQWDERTQQLLLLTGAHSGVVHISAVEVSTVAVDSPGGFKLRRLHSLPCRETQPSVGHAGDVRCFHWGGDRFLTGGEDGGICAWTERAGEWAERVGAVEKKMKKKSKQEGKSRHAPY